MRIKMFPEFSTIFTSQENLYNYLYGGQAIVTLESPTGIKHTYSYEKPKNQDHFPEDVIFVYCLHKSEDEYKKFYLGMIENDIFRRTRNSRFMYRSQVVKGAFYIEKMRKSQQFLSESKMSIYHQGTCGCCGSKISSDKSREIGFGRKCKKDFKLPDFERTDED